MVRICFGNQHNSVYYTLVAYSWGIEKFPLISGEPLIPGEWGTSYTIQFINPIPQNFPQELSEWSISIYASNCDTAQACDVPV